MAFTALAAKLTSDSTTITIGGTIRVVTLRYGLRTIYYIKYKDTIIYCELVLHGIRITESREYAWLKSLLHFDSRAANVVRLSLNDYHTVLYVRGAEGYLHTRHPQNK